tara:strand:+ start:51523 stop:52050 length:528 start_codon:yes stop_codon:yes gene_type:complete
MNLILRPLSLALTLFVSISCSSNEDEYQYSEGPFEIITLTRDQGLGYCPEEGDALSASIMRQNNEWMMQSAVAVVAPSGTDPSECLDPAAATCLQREVQPALTLTAEQAESLQDAVASVPAKECNADDNIVCDPCIVVSVEIDGSSANGQCCGDLNENFSQGFDELVRLIDGLAN